MTGIARNDTVFAGWRLALLFLVVAIALRCRDFDNPIIHVDEQYYLLVGDRMLHGALPYIDLWDRKPVGLFLIFAAIRLLPGDGILAYQLVATGCAVATAWLVASGGRQLGASAGGALVAGIAYILWLSLLSGRGGQSPVFYNLFMAAAACLTLRLPALAAARRPKVVLASGTVACLLAGLAIQTKYTPVVESVVLGLAHLWYLRRAGAGLAQSAAAGAGWVLLGALPTLLVVVAYWQRGPAVFDAFWFSNVTSIGLRRGYPAAKIIARLSGTTTQLSPFIVCAIASWRFFPRDAATRLAFAWLAAALVAYAMIGAFFDHYALPLLLPLTMICARVFGRYRTAALATLGIGLTLFAARVAAVPTEAASARAVARVMARYDGAQCPYVFAGDAVLYLLAHACTPTAYAFPSTLAYESERGATGIDEAAEVARILSRRPPVIVTMDAPLAPWNATSARLVTAALAQDYRHVFSAPREGGNLLVYVRRDRLAPICPGNRGCPVRAAVPPPR